MDELSNLRAALQELSELRRRVYSTTQLSTVSRACHTLVEYCTQKVDPFLDGFGEVNPWKRSAHKSEPEASKRSRDIDQFLVPASKIQIVCLPAPESGFDEILRKVNLNRTFSTTEADEYKRYLKQNLLTVLRYVAKLAGSSLSDNSQKLYKKLLRDDYGTNFDGIMTPHVADALRALWMDPAVKHTYNSVNYSPYVTDLIGHLTIDGILKYVDHLQDPSFSPTTLDAASLFDRTSGIREVYLQNEHSESQIQLLDLTNLPVVGEGDFCKHSWVSQFQNCNFIFCYVPLHTYDEKIDHEEPDTPQITNQQLNQNQSSTDPTASKHPVNNLIKSTSVGTSPSTKSHVTTTRARASSTNAKYSAKPVLKTVPSPPPQNSTPSESEPSTSPPSIPSLLLPSPTLLPSPSPLFPSPSSAHDAVPARESTLPPQVIGFDEHLSPKRKSHYRTSVINKRTTTHNFVKRTVQEKKNKSIHIAASHRFNSPNSSPGTSPLLRTHSPPSPSPSPPSPSSPTSPPTSPNSLTSPLTIPLSAPAKSARKPSASFLVVAPSPPSSPPKSIPNPLLAPLKIAHRKSWDNLLGPLDRMRANTTSLIPTPSSLGSHSAPGPAPASSARKPTHDRNSVSYGSLAPLSLVALPATPTLADLFKLPCYLKRFSALVNEESLLQVPVLVTFVVSPAFSEKLKHVGLDVCFPEYEGDNTEQSALDFIKKIFAEQNANPTRKILTTVLNTTGGNDPTTEVTSILSNAINTQMY